MSENLDRQMDEFLAQPAFAVAGASTNREKYGNKVVRAYQQNNRIVFPINPKATQVEGETAYPDLTCVPEGDVALSVVTPPHITLEVVKQALDRGIRHIWMQPGAENQEAVDLAKKAGANVIHDGPCVLVALGYRE